MSDTQKNKKPNVPNLRFPGVEGEWEQHLLSEYLDFKNGLNPSAKSFGEGIKFISVMDILNNPFITYDCIRASVNATEKEKQEFNVEYGDILFQRSSETLEDIGHANVYLDSRTALFGGFTIRGKKKGVYNPLFFKYLLDSPTARKKVIVKGAGAQHFNIGQEGLSKVVLSFPSIQEQNRIAVFMNLLDQRIAIQNKVIERYRSLIQALVQQASHKSTQTVYLKEILKERKELNSQGYDVCSVSVSKGVVNQVEYLGRSFAAKETRNYNVVRHGDIVYIKSPTGDFPYGIVKQSFLDNPVAVSPLYGVYIPESYEIGVYLHYYFESAKNALNYLHKLIQKGAKNTINITNQHFLENTIKIPSAAYLTRLVSAILSVDSRIRSEESALLLYQQQKQYMLSSLFL